MVGFGGMYCTSVLTYSYLFAQLDDKQQFQKSAGTVAVGVQLGKFVAGLSAQIIVSTTEGNVTVLPYLNAFGNLLDHSHF